MATKKSTPEKNTQAPVAPVRATKDEARPEKKEKSTQTGAKKATAKQTTAEVKKGKTAIAALPAAPKEKKHTPAALPTVHKQEKGIVTSEDTAKEALDAVHAAPTGDLTSTEPPAISFSLESDAPKEKACGKRLLRRIAACLLLFAVLCGSVLIYLYRPTAYTERVHSVHFAFDAETGLSTVIRDGKVVGSPLVGQCASYTYNDRGDVCAALVGTDLYLIRYNGVTLVARGVTDYTLSHSGRALAYRTSEGATLHYARLGRRMRISVIVDRAEAQYALSPDGKELFYAYAVEDVSRIGIYSRTNSAPELDVTVGRVPVAVSDACEHLYYRDVATGTLYYMDEKGKSAQIYTGVARLYFNRDLSELLLDNVTGTLLWRCGEQLLLNDLETGEHLRYLPNQRAASMASTTGVQYLVKSFLDGYFIRTGADEGGAMLVHLDRKGDMHRVAFVSEAISSVTVTDKGVYYISVPVDEGQRHLYYVKSGKSVPERLSSMDVTALAVGNSGERLFFTDQHGALYTMKRGEAPERLHVAESISPETLCVSASNFVYYAVGDTLWVSENGKEPRPLRDVPTGVTTNAHTAYFVGVNGDGSYSLWSAHRGADAAVAVPRSHMIK